MGRTNRALLQRCDCSPRSSPYKGIDPPAFVPMPIRVAIVEDNEKLRTTLGRVISRTEGYLCVGQFATAEEALQSIPSLKPEVV